MYILYNSTTCITGRLLRRVLGVGGGFSNHMTRRRPAELIRWGCSRGEDAETTLNWAEAIQRAANKLTALETMRDAGVRTVSFSTSAAELETPTPELPIFGRRRFGYGGQDIQPICSPEEASYFHSDLYTKYMESTHEMRIHIFENEMIQAQVKKYTREGDEPEPDIKIRNHARGYTFVPFVHTRPHEERVDTAVEAVGALGLDFGAVDLLVGTDGRSYVLEVNTAPGCTPRTLKAYARAFAGDSELELDFSILEEEENEV